MASLPSLAYSVHACIAIYYIYFCPIIVACSCVNMAVNFFPALSCMSMNLDTQRSRQMASPLLSSPSWYFGGMHFLRHDLVSLKYKVLTKHLHAYICIS